MANATASAAYGAILGGVLGGAIGYAKSPAKTIPGLLVGAVLGAVAQAGADLAYDAIAAGPGKTGAAGAPMLGTSSGGGGPSEPGRPKCHEVCYNPHTGHPDPLSPYCFTVCGQLAE